MVKDLKVTNGRFGFGDRVLFSDISFEVGDNQVLTILGPNGAGKTTLLKCVMGFYKWSSGKAEFNGRDISTFSPRELTKHLAYVPQMKSATFDYTVREMVMMGRSGHIGMYDSPSEADEAIVYSYLERLNIASLADRRYNTLSGGEMQLVMIARALVSEPEILVLDEPESNLDYSNQLRIMDLIEELSGEMTCIINTHYPEHALRISDKTLMLDGKGNYIFGDTADVITEENLMNVFRVKARTGSMTENGETYRFIIPIGRLRCPGCVSVRRPTAVTVSYASVRTYRRARS